MTIKTSSLLTTGTALGDVRVGIFEFLALQHHHRQDSHFTEGEAEAQGGGSPDSGSQGWDSSRRSLALWTRTVRAVWGLSQ